MVTGSGPSFSTARLMPSAASVAREMVSRSTGGAPAGRSRSPGCSRTIAATRRASRRSGTAAQIQVRLLGCTTTLHCFEHPHPTELGELTLMGVEHEFPGIAEPGFEDRAFPLAEHDRVGALRRC